MESEWIDVSVPIRTGMESCCIIRPFGSNLVDIDRGDHANVSAITMGSHTGTHMDAPVHFLRSGRGIDEAAFIDSHRAGQGDSNRGYEFSEAG